MQPVCTDIGAGVAARGVREPSVRDEQGTKAAAASGVQVMMSAAELPRAAVPMVVDHPFRFVIRDRASNLPLLIARVSDPA